MELKIFRDALPAAGANCTVKAELPLETEILTETEAQLETYCTAQCSQQFGLDVSVTVTLEKAGQQVVVKKAVAAFPAGCTAAQKQAVLCFLQHALGITPTAAEESTP